MTMKAGESQPSSLKAETRRYQPLHRLSCTVNLTKADTSSSAAVFSFKSNEHAERRKEFYMELQQKMHAKEAEMNQMQVRRQEKTEAEIKQFRRSLNFKATPMPSFYHVAVPRRSDGKKAPSSNSKVNKARDKSTNPGSRAAGRSKSCLKEGSDQASSTNESVNTTARIDALEKTNCPTGEHSEGSASSQTLPSNQSCFLGVGVENKVGRRKEREKERDTSMYKHRVSEIHKVMKGQRAEGKQKVGAREMARKDMKSSGIGSSSGLGNLVVGVAS
ncbi:protein WVD2-like 7 [Carya illinoinensis]|uniref:protein WVD2-like 7 n=1 Tax=Carya illinoinensis TaxID=32201 RepID=UPI001C71A3FC|nr:protein WVD2-like 7 [Carya illinoinensis]